MHAQHQPLRHALRRVAVVGATGSLVAGGLGIGGAAPATASPGPASAGTVATSVAAPAKVAATTKRKMLNRKRLLAYAAKQKGKPYRYGANGPRSFDCSGFTQYVYKSQKRKLPRTSRAQYRFVKRLHKRSAKPGDLVFFKKSGRVYHVAVYAGGNRMWHSPRSGSRVKLVKIYQKTWTAGRVA